MNVRAWVPLVIGSVATAAWSPQAAARCRLQNHANFQISQSAWLEVSKEDPPDKILRQGTAFGEGVELLRCDEGLVAFRGHWTQESHDEYRSLTVGGIKAGVGVRLRLTEQGGAIERAFPHGYQRMLEQDESIRSDGDALHYELFRTADPVVFGPVDPGPVAYTDVQDASGGWVRFRSMMIYDLALQRPACSIEPDDLNQRVVLPTYSTSNFDPVEKATPWVVFRMRVRACSDPDGLFAQMRFGLPGDALPGQPDWFALPQGAPDHVALELGREDRRTIRPGEAFRVTALGAGESYEFAVRLREAGGPAGPGRFERHVRVEVEFL
jgi:type 1 fimbria pilin